MSPPSTSLAPEPVSPAILAAVRAPFEAWSEATGAEWTDAPTLQPLSMLLELAGEAMRARLFVVQAEGGAELALRPDFTLALAQALVARGGVSGRWLYAGQAFRTAPPGSSRPAEFLQIGADVFGSGADPAVEDGEIASLAWRSASAGGRADLSLRFGDVSLFAGFLRALGLPDGVRERLGRAFASGRAIHAELERMVEGSAPSAADARLPRLLADLPEAEAAAVLEELWSLAGIQPVGGRGAAEIVHRLVERAAAERSPRLSRAEAQMIASYLSVDAPPAQALDRVQALAHGVGGGLDPLLEGWRRRLMALDAGGVPAGGLTLVTGLARPFGYYDGMLFEVRSRALAADEPVAAGGRYDGLLGRMKGAASPAVGCMVRPGRAELRAEARS